MPDANAGGASDAASEARVRAAARALGVELPDFYAQFLRRSDGVPRDDGLLLYAAEDLAERNETFQVREYAPGFLAIGDDSGGRAFMIALDGSPAVYIVDQGSMDPDDFEDVHPDFRAWIGEMSLP